MHYIAGGYESLQGSDPRCWGRRVYSTSKSIKEANRRGRTYGFFLSFPHCICLLFEELNLWGGWIMWKEHKLWVNY